MKPYAVVWSASAAATMRKLDRTVSRRIRAKVLQAAADPDLISLRLVNSPYRRIRVGDWRVIIHVDHGKVLVVVIEVARRSRAYP